MFSCSTRLPRGAEILSRQSAYGVLVLHHNDIIWLSTNGLKQIRRYECVTTPIDAIICEILFDSAYVLCCAILLTSNLVSLHFSSGERFDIPLTNNFDKLMSAPNGFILQKSHNETDGPKSMLSHDQEVFHLHTSLYSFSHPFAQARPIASSRRSHASWEILCRSDSIIALLDLRSGLLILCRILNCEKESSTDISIAAIGESNSLHRQTVSSRNHSPSTSNRTFYSSSPSITLSASKRSSSPVVFGSTFQRGQRPISPREAGSRKSPSPSLTNMLTDDASPDILRPGGFGLQSHSLDSIRRGSPVSFAHFSGRSGGRQSPGPLKHSTGNSTTITNQFDSFQSLSLLPPSEPFFLDEAHGQGQVPHFDLNDTNNSDTCISDSECEPEFELEELCSSGILKEQLSSPFGSVTASFSAGLGDDAGKLVLHVTHKPSHRYFCFDLCTDHVDSDSTGTFGIGTASAEGITEKRGSSWQLEWNNSQRATSLAPPATCGSVAHIQLPIGSVSNKSKCAAIPVTFCFPAVSGCISTRPPDVTMLVGSTAVGKMQLSWFDDMNSDDDDEEERQGPSESCSIAASGHKTIDNDEGLTQDLSFVTLGGGTEKCFGVVNRSQALQQFHVGSNPVSLQGSAIFSATPLALFCDNMANGQAVVAIIKSLLARRNSQPKSAVDSDGWTRLADLTAGLMLQYEIKCGSENAILFLLAVAFGLQSLADDLLSHQTLSTAAAPAAAMVPIESLQTCARNLSAHSISLNAGPLYFDSVHMVWEDFRLRGSFSDGSHQLLVALHTIANAGGGACGRMYTNYYSRSGLGLNVTCAASTFEFTLQNSEVPSSVRWLTSLIETVDCSDSDSQRTLSRCDKDRTTKNFSAFENCTDNLAHNVESKSLGCLRLTAAIFRSLLSDAAVGASMQSSTEDSDAFALSVVRNGQAPTVLQWHFRLVKAFVSAIKMVTATHDGRSSEVALPLSEALYRVPLALRSLLEASFHLCREKPSSEWPEEVLNYIDRQDVVRCREQSQPHNRLGRNGTGIGGSLSVLDSVQQSPSSSRNTTLDGISRGDKAGRLGVGSSDDGLPEVEAVASRRFAEDDRVHEVCRLLRSSRPLYVRIDRTPEMNEEKFRETLQIRLLNLVRRSLGCAVGRGMMTMNSLQPLPLMADVLPLPALDLTGRVPPSNTVVNLDGSVVSPELTLWPDFHNGVAAGLRISASSTNDIASLCGLTDPRRKNAGDSSSNPSGGVTRNWIMYNKTTSAAAGKSSTHSGMLLALGLQGHLKVLNQFDRFDYLNSKPDPTKVALLIGLAASHLGSEDPRVSLPLRLHLPALLPPNTLTAEEEPSTTVQAAAMVGLGLLYCGSAHRLVVEFLVEELTRKPVPNRCENRESLALSAGWALGMILLAKGVQGGVAARPGPQGGTEETLESLPGLSGLTDLRLEERLQLLIDGGRRLDLSSLFQVPPTVDSNAVSSRVLEGDMVNTDVTAIGGIVAMALIFMKSNNRDIAQRIAVPSSSLRIDSMRPDLLLFRALGTCLVMWDSVTAAPDWMDSQMPHPISQTLFGTALGERNNSSRLTLPTAFEAYLCVSAGLCLGLGLVHAGTGSGTVKNVILTRLKILQSFRDNKPAFPVGGAHKLLRAAIDMCTCTAALGLASAMAGTGDVDCLRVFRELRWKIDDVTYGSHLGISMAIGLLFLSGGTASLRRDPVATGCLLIACCPRFPSRCTDNQYHLQALRHLYALATETRLLQALDVDSRLPVRLCVRVQLKTETQKLTDPDVADGISQRSPEMKFLVTPCLLPELATVHSIHVCSREETEAFLAAEVVRSELKSAGDRPSAPGSIASRGGPGGNSSDLRNRDYFQVTLRMDESCVRPSLPVLCVKKRSGPRSSTATIQLSSDSASTPTLLRWAVQQQSQPTQGRDLSSGYMHSLLQASQAEHTTLRRGSGLMETEGGDERTDLEAVGFAMRCSSMVADICNHSVLSLITSLDDYADQNIR